MIYTNQQTFNISIGIGGGGPYSSINFSPCSTTCADIESINFNGESTSITNTDVNFIAGGGYMHSGGIASTSSQDTNNVIYIAQQGNIQNYIRTGNSPQNGALPPHPNQCFSSNTAYGYGSQFYNNSCDQNNCDTKSVLFGSGGNVILYFTPKSPSISLIINSSIYYDLTPKGITIDILVIVCIITIITISSLVLILIIYCIKTSGANAKY